MVDFLIIGTVSSITYRDIFPLIKDGNVSFGWNRVLEFEDGAKFGNIRWFSNISDYCPPKLELKKPYNYIDYHKFDNYDCINIDRISDIPVDYDGLMGVPITFIDKWNPVQFELIGLLSDNKGDGIYIFNGTETYTDERHKKSKCGVIDGKRIFNKLLIKTKNKFA